MGNPGCLGLTWETLLQTVALMKKWSTMYWRSPAYNLTRFLMTTLIALFYGTMYLQKGHLPKSGMGPSG